MAKGDSLKQRIRDGEVIVGASVPIDSDRQLLESVLSKYNYDYFYIDSQHLPLNEEKLVAFCKIATEVDVPVHFRIKHTKLAYLVGNCLDLGPLSVEVPQVELESTVDDAVNYFYYPQFGIRSVGGGARYGLQGRNDAVEYTKWWNNTGVLCIQLESVQATTNVLKLAKPGVDMFSWGPSD